VSGHFDLNQSYGQVLMITKIGGQPTCFLRGSRFICSKNSTWIPAPLAPLQSSSPFYSRFIFFIEYVNALFNHGLRLLPLLYFAYQPLLWGHAFINPKDMPFLVFLTGSIFLGFGWLIN